MEGRPLRVFVSHTSELREYPAGRSFVAAAEQAVLRAGGAVHWTWSTSPPGRTSPPSTAASRCGRPTCTSGILGFRYGSPVRDEKEHSYTELEFAAATELGLPRLVFLLDDDAVLPLPRSVPVRPDYEERQAAFRARVAGAGITIQKVGSPERLEMLLFQALTGPADGPGARRRR